ncbi:hypothetical protein CEXT_70461 [Caerostris extrusa]|uniref:Uncharacterized protein n=1 Tax=Caerostris extrusa TaxID=172846 RepID=A0AAV4WK94_CAEEX|nr:hypothetical protein CEXT_70461 [Caerostris extrusa]
MAGVNLKVTATNATHIIKMKEATEATMTLTIFRDLLLLDVLSLSQARPLGPGTSCDACQSDPLRSLRDVVTGPVSYQKGIVVANSMFLLLVVVVVMFGVLKAPE